MARTAPLSRIAIACAVLAMAGTAATAVRADFDPDDLPEADRQLLINILEFEATSITRGLPASGASIVIVRTDTSPRICRFFRIREADGDEATGVGCRSGQQLWDLAASEEDIPPALFEPPPAAVLDQPAGRSPAVAQQSAEQYLGDPSDAEAAALEAAAAASGLDAGLPSVTDFAPPMPPLRPETLAALPPPPAPEGPGLRPVGAAETMSPLVIEPVPQGPGPSTLEGASGLETVSAPNGRIFRVPSPVPPRAPSPDPAPAESVAPVVVEPSPAEPSAPTAAEPATVPEVTVAATAEPDEVVQPAPAEPAAAVPIGPEFPLPLRRPATQPAVETAAAAAPEPPPVEPPSISVEEIPAFVPLEVPAPGRRPGS